MQDSATTKVREPRLPLWRHCAVQPRSNYSLVRSNLARAQNEALSSGRQSTLSIAKVHYAITEAMCFKGIGI